MSHALHDALRDHGLVPPGEDVHFDACSIWYRQMLNAVSADMPDDEEFEHMQRYVVGAEEMLASLKSENRELKKQIAALEKTKAKASKSESK